MPSLDSIQDTLDTLYSGVNGYGLSQADRVGERREQKSLTYGEMLLEPFSRVLAAVKPAPGEVFYDLGSGTGKVVLMANMLAPFAKTVGIEFLPKLHDQASAIVDRYAQEIKPSLPDATAEIAVRQGDMLTEDLTDADVIFVHSTCMGEELIAGLAERVRACKPTTRFALISRGFFGMPWLANTERFDYTNAWNTQSTCFVYKLAA